MAPRARPARLARLAVPTMLHAHEGAETGDYHERPRLDVVDVARRHDLSGRVLDIGCAAGVLGRLLLDAGLATSVVGVESDPAVARRAEAQLTNVVAGDATDPDLIAGLPRPVDALIFADVLEHLVEPLETLTRYVQLLAPGGVCIVSVPNVRYFRVVSDLVVRNQWTYQAEGVCDRTHLRFFTLHSATRLCSDAGLDVLGVYAPLTQKGRTVGRAAPPLVTFLTPQLIFACRPRA